MVLTLRGNIKNSLLGILSFSPQTYLRSSSSSAQLRVQWGQWLLVRGEILHFFIGQRAILVPRRMLLSWRRHPSQECVRYSPGHCCSLWHCPQSSWSPFWVSSLKRIFLRRRLQHHSRMRLSKAGILFVVLSHAYLTGFGASSVCPTSFVYEPVTLSEWPVLHTFSSAFRTQLRGDPFLTSDPLGWTPFLWCSQAPRLLSSLVDCTVLKPPPVHLLCTSYFSIPCTTVPGTCQIVSKGLLNANNLNYLHARTQRWRG